jgi:hypothetical protein
VWHFVIDGGCVLGCDAWHDSLCMQFGDAQLVLDRSF